MTVNRFYSSKAVDTTLVADVEIGESTITVPLPFVGYPTSYPYTLAIGYDSGNEELVDVTGVSGGTITVVRGRDNTPTVKHYAGEKVKHVVSGRDLRESQEHIAGTTEVHGIANTALLVSTADSGVVSSGMLASNSVTSAKVADSNITTAKIADSAVTSAKIADGTIVNADISGSAAIDWTKLAVSSTVSSTELGHLDGVTSGIQTQLTNQTSALASHAADTTAIHGIADTSKLANVASASAGRTIFVQAATPTALAVGDIWFQVTGL